jgi:hypothetical protein
VIKADNMKPAGNQQKKKIIIQPFKSQPKIPPNFEIISWNKLQEAINGVFHSRPIEMSKEELYRVSFPFPLILLLSSFSPRGVFSHRLSLSPRPLSFRSWRICVFINLVLLFIRNCSQKLKLISTLKSIVS